MKEIIIVLKLVTSWLVSACLISGFSTIKSFGIQFILSIVFTFIMMVPYPDNK